MSYQEIPIGSHVSPALASFIGEAFDEFFFEFRFLFTVKIPEQGAKPPLLKPLSSLLLMATDGAAQLLQPGKMSNRDRFKMFLEKNYPWDLDSPDGLTKEEACDFLWEEARCPMLHRFGLRTITTRQKSPFGQVRYARTHVSSEEDLNNLETLIGEKPYSESSIIRKEKCTTLWIGSFYWGLRIAISRSLDTKEKSEAVENWIKSGKWDPKN